MKLLILTHLSATLMMTGIIWFIQIVHYPLFNRVGASEFASYEAAHTTLTTCVVMPLMFVELFSAALLLFLPTPSIPPLLLWAGIGLLAIIWLSTAVLQVPLHNTLAAGFDQAAYERLVATNWLRTGAWSVRAVIALVLTAS